MFLFFYTTSLTMSLLWLKVPLWVSKIGDQSWGYVFGQSTVLELFPVWLERFPLHVLAMSSRSWLSYSYQSRFHLTPLSYETLEFASGFASEQCPEGIVAISTNTLRWEKPYFGAMRRPQPVVLPELEFVQQWLRATSLPGEGVAVEI